MIDSTVAAAPKFQEAPSFAVNDTTVLDTAKTSVIHGDSATTTTWVDQSIHVSISQNPDDYFMYDPLTSVLWPGNLVQGNSIAGGVPNSIPIADRAGGSVTLGIVSGDSAGTVNRFSRALSSFSFSTVTQAENEILAGYHGGTPAKYSYSRVDAHTATQLNLDLGFGYSGPATTVDAQLGGVIASSGSTIAVRLTQQFFTMVFDDPQGAAGVLGPTVTDAALAPYTGPGNPVCYISSVTYGRIYILVYHSSASRDSLSAALDFAYNGGFASGNVTAATTYQHVLDSTSVSIIQIGGDPSAGLSAGLALNGDSIAVFLSRGANFSPTNVGAPISYTIKYLADASLVRMNNTTDYTVVQRTPINSSTAVTQTAFQVFFQSFNDHCTLGAGCFGGITLRVGKINTVTGANTFVWTGPIGIGVCDTTAGNIPGCWHDYGSAGMDDAGNPYGLDWTVPQFQLDNSPTNKWYFEFWINDYDGGSAQRYWGVSRYYFTFDPLTNTWSGQNGESLGGTAFTEGSGPSVSVPGSAGVSQVSSFVMSILGRVVAPAPPARRGMAAHLVE